MSETSMQHPFEDYIVYRYRLRELLHLFDIHLHLVECAELSPPPEDHLSTFRLLTISHLAGFFDTRSDSLRVIEVWRKYFPQHRAAIDKLEADLKPALDKARTLRHKAGAHSDLSTHTQTLARGGFTQGEAAFLLDRFLEVAGLVNRSEREVEGLAEQIAKWEGLLPGDELPTG